MPREIQQHFVCDCERYHSYVKKDTYEPIGWLSVVVNMDSDGHPEITIKKVEYLSEVEAAAPDRKFFVNMDCFEAWAQDILFPPQLKEPEPEPVAAEKP